MNNRKTTIVNRQLQMKYINVMLLFNLIGTFVIIAILSLVIKHFLTSMTTTERFIPDALRTMVMPAVAAIGLVYLGVSSLAIWFFMARITHRVAGPLYRINRSLEEMTQGNLMPGPSLRKGDDLFETYESMKGLMERLAWDMHSLKKTVESLEKTGIPTDGLREIKKVIEGYTIPPMD
jgi:hypothetical protein